MSNIHPLITLNHIGFSIQKKPVGFFNNSSHQFAIDSSVKGEPPILSNNKDLLVNINMTVMPNEKISIIGPNGAGKSTLIKLVLGLIKPTSGHLVYHKDVVMGYVPQKFTVPTILPLRVLDLLAQVKNRLTSSQQSQLYERLSIEPLLKKQVIYLSGGEMQRVLLARSLLNKPNLLILDEPMQGLDPESERWLYEFIDNLPEFLHCAMVVVSHDLHWVMLGSRRVICLNKHICCEGQPSELSLSEEFKSLFGHQYEQPYVHRPHVCQHTSHTAVSVADVSPNTINHTSVD